MCKHNVFPSQAGISGARTGLHSSEPRAWRSLVSITQAGALVVVSRSTQENLHVRMRLTVEKRWWN